VCPCNRTSCIHTKSKQASSDQSQHHRVLMARCSQCPNRLGRWCLVGWLTHRHHKRLVPTSQRVRLQRTWSGTLLSLLRMSVLLSHHEHRSPVTVAVVLG